MVAGVGKSWSQGIPSQEGERDECFCFGPLSPFCSVEDLSLWDDVTHFWSASCTSINLNDKIPHDSPVVCFHVDDKFHPGGTIKTKYHIDTVSESSTPLCA